MVTNFFDRLKDDRKYFTIVFFIFIILVLTGVLSPILINNKRENWPNTLSENIVQIEQKIRNEFESTETELLEVNKSVKNGLHRLLSADNVSYGEIVKIINRQTFDDYSIEVLAPNGKLIAWNSNIAIPQEEIFPLDYPIGETYFLKSDLVTYLTITDTIFSESDVFYIICSQPFEKHYNIKNDYYKEKSFSKRISDQNSVQADIAFNPVEPATKDGRKYSFDILNNKNNKIGQITISKPILEVSMNRISSTIEKFQSILVVLAILFFGLGLRKEFIQLRSSLYKAILLTMYLVVFRYLIYQVGFPSNIINGPLSDASFFSSAFAGGVVRSPIEFLLTAIFFAILCVKVYQYGISYIFSLQIEKLKRISKYSLFIGISLILIFFLGLRGLSASIKSVIFDSTLRYFRDPELLPDAQTLVMNLGVLLLGTSVVLILTLIIIYLIAYSRIIKYFSSIKYFVILFFFFQITGLVFILIQKQPLINILVIIFLITVVFALAYHIYFKIKKSKYAYVYAALCGALITIVQLNYFNSELEKESLKTAAAEINRPNDNLLKFLVSEVLFNSSRDEKVLSAFNRKSTNYDAEAYAQWCKSSLQREALKSSISFWDTEGKILGQFWIGVEKIITDIKPTFSLIKDDPIIFEEKELTQVSKTITGVAPVVVNSKRVGFISVSILWDPHILILSNVPGFLQSKTSLLNSVLDFSQLKIFEFSDFILVNVYGDIYPSRDEVSPITKFDFLESEDVWLNLNLNEERYITYALKHNTDGKVNVTAVSLLEKKISWSLFNFFKLFIIQSIFIIILLVVLFISELKNFNYTFKFQLTIAFLVVSLIPVIILALYNRKLVEMRTDESIKNELRERAKYVENYIHTKLSEGKDASLTNVFEAAGNDLGISFSVFNNSVLIFNSDEQYFNAGVFPERIHPWIYFNLNYLSFVEFKIQEHVEEYYFNSYYKKITINNQNYVLAVNDLFNEVKLTLSTNDFDVLLFGIYLLAALIIILISTFLADKISSPIRRLTKATMSVAQGDLNITLQNKEKGDLKSLFDGFNLMTNELKKNQTELAELEREAAWKEMAKQVAHEIKNPLTPMKLSIQQLIATFRDKNKNFEEIFEKVSSTILNQIESLSSIASEFSRFAKMPSYKLEPVNIRNLTTDVINLFTDESVNIELDIEERVPQVNADNSQVRRLLINLIRNSIQAGASEIKLRIDCENGFCNLFVKDNGKGIMLENREKIFEQNFTTKSSGMGLGLKLAKRFLDGIGGDIQLVETAAHGTTFRIRFPIHSPK